MTKKKIGLIGFGCVGQGFYKILQEQNISNTEIVKIAVKHKKERSAPTELFVYDVNQILKDENIDIIVELINDAEVAFDIVSKSLRKGTPVISANKKMIAENLKELVQLQGKTNTPFLYEGAVCGSIPILQTLTNYFSFDQIKRISGIFNGSSNYILSKIFNEKLTYQVALSEAQELGFAETDPTLDVGGFDPKFKLSILTKHAFGQTIDPTTVLNIGIDQITKQEYAFAEEHGLKIKLIAKAEKTSHGLALIVAPYYVQKSEKLFHIEDENNAVMIDNQFADEQLLVGKGAGSLPTGSAVFADLNNLINGFRYTYKDEVFEIAENIVTAFVNYGDGSFDHNAFEEVNERYTGKGVNYAIGKISTENLTELNAKKKVSIVLLTEKSTNHVINKLSYSYAS